MERGCEVKRASRARIDLHRVLAECNRIRKMLAMKPAKRVRKGVRYSACDCPVAKTIAGGTFVNTSGSKQFSGVWWGDFTKPEDKPVLLDPAPYLTDFGNRFDNGEFPELVL